MCHHSNFIKSKDSALNSSENVKLINYSIQKTNYKAPIDFKLTTENSNSFISP